ncbi:NCS2 family permease [Candidatus Sulfidibacterium hydrothermale]|uniref:NCS2 family permease n=1 Tax=Candidatus Sulfidibacterium hydrothermale TaxID=2875962 RepID=UPI001F0AD731|nr:NCS2 family permease [Candidatus Sulfidibacterium hydrothermale]UBM61732.1 NCS2 family permease [Candidatus Sulfidibacterium hydrothermale]
MLEKYFQLEAHKTNVKTEVIAGITTFLTMAYILVVNPSILHDAGMNTGAVFTATAIASIIGTLIMALYAKLPIAMAPGMGLNAFFAYTVVVSMGYSWEFALTAVFLEGILFILLTFFNVRELIVDAIPLSQKHAISVGIGLFIAFIGLEDAGIIVHDKATLVTLGNLGSPSALIALFGLFISALLLTLRVKGALLIGIFSSTILAVFMGKAALPDTALIQTPPSLAPTFLKFEWQHIFSTDMLIVLFTFLFVDLFDTIGTLVGVASQAGILDEKGRFPNVKKALMADAFSTTAGAMLGTSTTTAYIESAAGVAEGGRTGLTTLVVAILFILSLFLSPLFLMVPSSATAPVLILVGTFMMEPVTKISFSDYTESIPAFLAIIMMPLTYSIAEGIAFGMISYVLLKALTGRHKEITPVMYILAALFMLKFFV